MFILIITGLLGLIFSLFIILYFTSKDVIGDSANSTEDYTELDTGSCDKATHQGKEFK